jgi:LruC domain-containing protein
VINGSVTYSYNQAYSLKSTNTISGDAVKILYGKTVISTLAGFDAQGVPANLEKVNDVVDAAMLSDVNASIPEYMPVPEYHPEYLASNAETDVILDEKAEVWVTFLHEGAGYMNSLGFFTYKKGNAPATSKDIDTIHVIFPNASYKGSGGGLTAGNRVKIGTFDANTAIGWVCIANGFSNGTITTGTRLYFSNPDYNSESNASLRQHNVLLYDANREKVLLGFEDLKRDNGSDNDFNDVVFYVTSNPVTAIENGNYPKVTNTAKDEDNDGISDNNDDYPQDPDKAFDNYYPSKYRFTTLAFEDLWPGQGDYDMNDVTVDLQINEITNSNNEISVIKGKSVLKALGSSYHNGFGIHWPLDPSLIAKASGNRLTTGKIEVADNGLEKGDKESVFILFDDGFDILKNTGTFGLGINTNPDAPYVQPDTMDFSVEFAKPQRTSDIGKAPYNPFIFINQQRGREVHLPDMAPTLQADPSYFGTSHDDSNPEAGRYYKTEKNLPWAINVMGGFEVPVEKLSIEAGYNHFREWAQSEGTFYPDWYLNLSGYRNSKYVYSKK